MDHIIIKLGIDTVESIVAFIKNHERDEIPDDVWDFCMQVQEDYDIY